jgi:hypothetical protein
MKRPIMCFIAVTALVLASCSSEEIVVEKTATLPFNKMDYVKVWRDANIQANFRKEKE